VYILADDLGIGDVGCYGQEKFSTPAIDKLAAGGLKFTHHYAGSTVCAPSRCSLMTGLHTGHSYIRGNGPMKLRPAPLDATVFEKLKEAGYTTALVGKSGLSGNVSDGAHPATKGVDHFFGFVDHREAHHYFPPTLFRDGVAVNYPNNSKHEGDSYSSDLFLKDALQFIDEHKDGPFFLHYATQIPHASLYAPEDWKAKYRGKFTETPVINKGGHYRSEPEPRTTFAAMVSRLDWEVGEIVAKLTSLGIEKNTLVVFCSDNGPTAVGGYDPTFFKSSGPFRGEKRSLNEGGIRTPMIAWWPGTITPARETGHVSAFWDFLPTACELAGMAVPSELDGISYLPTLTGKGEQRSHDYLYWEFYEGSGDRAVLMDNGRWKAIQTNVKKSPDSPVKLFDLTKDIHEDTDVSAEHPELIARARNLFEAAHTPTGEYRWNKAATSALPKAH
jgi:arylsulfatase A-like enzyme